MYTTPHLTPNSTWLQTLSLMIIMITSWLKLAELAGFLLDYKHNDPASQTRWIFTPLTIRLFPRQTYIFAMTPVVVSPPSVLRRRRSAILCFQSSFYIASVGRRIPGFTFINFSYNCNGELPTMNRISSSTKIN